MTMSDPLPVTIVGDAKIHRHLYLPNYPDTQKSFTVWVAELTGIGDRFIYRPMDTIDFETGPIDFIDKIIETDRISVKNFHVVESETTDNLVVFLFDNGEDMYLMEYNFETDVMVTAPSRIYEGIIPSMIKRDGIRSLYIRDNSLKMRETFTGVEVNLLEHSEFFSLDQDTDDKPDTIFAYYCGRYMYDTDVPIPIEDKTDSVIAYDDHTHVTGPPVGLEDLSGNGYDLEVGLTHVLSDHGLIFTDSTVEPEIDTWTVPALITIEAWVIPKFYAGDSYILKGDIYLKYYNSGRIEFGFEGSATTHRYFQTDDLFLRAGEMNHVLITHEFGAIHNTIMALNGKEVACSWFGDDGLEDPGFTTLTSYIKLAFADTLHSFRLSNTLRTLAQIDEYVKGRSL